MLLGFRTANVLSFRTEQQFSLVASDLYGGPALATGLREGGRRIAVMPAVGVFGANASGKSNLLTALAAMRSTILDSSSWIADPNPVRRTAFALDTISSREPSMFEADILLDDGVRYTYGVEVDDQRFRGEWLHAYPKGRRQVWFERTDDDVDFVGDGLRGEKLELSRRTRGDSLFLAVAAQFNHEQLLPVFEWFRDNLTLIRPDGHVDGQLRTGSRVLRDSAFRERVGRILQVADIGVTGFDPDSLARGEIRFLHRAGSRDVPLEFGAESLGTRSWFGLIGTLLDSLDAGSVVLVDELDASLHPAMSSEAVQMFQDRTANPRRSQMVFTSHDPTLLGTMLGPGRILDRDAVWLTEKLSDGGTEIYPLTSVNPPPRKEDNLLRKYLSGHYGGMPRVSPGAVAREAAELAQ